MEPSKHDFVDHLNPARRGRANFVIHADIAEAGSPRRWEQLWTRQLAPDRFELCCIPFFVYDLALADEVSTVQAGAMEYIYERVVRPSGHAAFRAWFGDSSHPGARDEIVRELRAMGYELEWYSENLLAVDAADGVGAQQLADLLMAREQLGHLVYETGRTI